MGGRCEGEAARAEQARQNVQSWSCHGLSSLSQSQVTKSQQRHQRDVAAASSLLGHGHGHRHGAQANAATQLMYMGVPGYPSTHSRSGIFARLASPFACQGVLCWAVVLRRHQWRKSDWTGGLAGLHINSKVLLRRQVPGCFGWPESDVRERQTGFQTPKTAKHQTGNGVGWDIVLERFVLYGSFVGSTATVLETRTESAEEDKATATGTAKIRCNVKGCQKWRCESEVSLLVPIADQEREPKTVITVTAPAAILIEAAQRHGNDPAGAPPSSSTIGCLVLDLGHGHKDTKMPVPLHPCSPGTTNAPWAHVPSGSRWMHPRLTV